MKDRIESILRQFPEVKWDRWAGDLNALQVFGWIAREDGRADFVILGIIDGEVFSCATSSAAKSEAFSKRLGLPHTDCRRVADDFNLKGGE